MYVWPEVVFVKVRTPLFTAAFSVEFFLPIGTYTFAAYVTHVGLNYGSFRTIEVLGNLSFTMRLAFHISY